MSNSLWPLKRSLPGFSVHGILQTKVLEWIAISFSRWSSWPMDQTQVSCIVSRFFTVWAMREVLLTKLFTELLKLLNNPKSYGSHFSLVQSCPTLCNPMDCSTPGFLVHHQLLEITQTHHVHRVGDTIQPSHPLSSPSPPTFNRSQHHSLFK